VTSFDLCFPLLDIPDSQNLEWYRAAAKLMVTSARRAYRGHDMRIIQLTDETSQRCDDIDGEFTLGGNCTRETLAKYRGKLTAEWCLQTDRPAILCDVDLLWNTDGLTGCFQPPSPGIILTYRPGFPFQPFNGGMILTNPDQTEFWAKYKSLMDNLPVDVHGWWGDQIGLAVMMGTPQHDQNGDTRFGSRVVYLPMEIVCPAPKSMPEKLWETPAIHMKGSKRKPWLVGYFEMLMAQPIARELQTV